MRSSSFCVLLVLSAALAMAGFAPVASASANVTIYSDSECGHPVGSGHLYFPYPSSTKCLNTSGPAGVSSAIFHCDNTAGYTNLTLTTWSSSVLCDSDDRAVLASYGVTGSCGSFNITVLNNGSVTAVSFFATVDCFDSVTGELVAAPVQLTELARTFQADQRAAAGGARRGRRGRMPRK